MADPLSLFVLAGEASGDRIGADLVRRLRARTDVELIGVGGEALTAEGLASLYPMTDLSVMGLADVLRRLPLLLWRLRQTVRAILEAKPDIVVLIDSQEFSAMAAARLRRAGHEGPIVLYVAPAVWAYRPERAARIEPLFDEVLAVLPFEPEAMRELGGPPTAYVGHPALAEARIAEPGRHGRVALLPGSREGELRRHLPLFREVVARLSGVREAPEFYMPTLSHLLPALEAGTADWAAPVRLVADRAERLDLYRRTDMAVVTSGTATLELGLAGVPMVLTYVLDAGQRRYWRRAGNAAIGLPNILLGQRLVPEFVFDETPEPAMLAAAAAALYADEAARGAQAAAFERLVTLMETGLEGTPREDPAARVLALAERGGKGGAEGG